LAPVNNYRGAYRRGITPMCKQLVLSILMSFSCDRGGAIELERAASDGVLRRQPWFYPRLVAFLALVLDVVYQIIELRFVYPGEAIRVAFVLAIVPYLTLRGLVTRLARKSDVRHQHVPPE
jgi:hypothetical protein